jgi:threonine synthase
MDSDEKELLQEEYKDFKENAELKAIVAGYKAKKATIKIGDIEVAITPSLKKGLRDKIVRIAKQYEAGDMETADEDIYETMAEICIESPYNKPAVWKYLDEETGFVPNVMQMMIEKITAQEGAAQRFRKQ